MIAWDHSIWFFDIDDTLIDTAGTTQKASEGIRGVFEKRYSNEIAGKIFKSFNEKFNLMLAGYRVKNDDWSHVPGGEASFGKLLINVEKLQPNIIRQYGHAKKWSREIFIKLACDENEVECEPETIHAAADEYWNTLSEMTIIYDGVLQLFSQIREHGRPIYFITSSDARLKMNSDGFFDYIPERSEKLKRERIEKLISKGLWFNGLSIGDPEDKPHVDFFEKGISIARSELDNAFKYENSIMVGDSFAGDLQTPKETLHFGLVALYEKERAGPNKMDEHEVHVGNPLDITQYLS